MNPTTIEIVATVLFVIAVIHTFLVSKFQHLAHRYPEGSIGENLFHFLGEVEAVFGIWSGIFILVYAATEGFMITDANHHVIGGAVHFLESINYTEPAFVFVIMCMAATRPILLLTEKLITLLAKIFPFPEKMSFYISALIFGPLLGSFITEPAAMTVTALLLLKNFYSDSMSNNLRYATLGLLFVNISIGGTLTHFAAPPVLMVASKWGWDTGFMMTHFGYKAAFAIIISTLTIALFFRKELNGEIRKLPENGMKFTPPLWITLIHIFSLAIVVLTAHHMVFFLGFFLFFLGFCVVTQEYQDEMKIKESLLVGFFLAGLVTLGVKQAWWLQPVLSQLGDLTLFFGAVSLTAITDNAALTYLGSLVELSEGAKYALVSGAVVGGGLTVIANAPNPAGYGILKGAFGSDGISPMGLLLSAIFPTAVAAACFLLLPSL
jgi:Na+/H+ antiporter NhaD/arsenite permease-like protein